MVVNGLFHLLINGVYWGCNPLILAIDPNFQPDILTRGLNQGSTKGHGNGCRTWSEITSSDSMLFRSSPLGELELIRPSDLNGRANKDVKDI